MAALDHQPNDLDVHAGLKIRTRRNEIGMSQETLADKIGVTFQQVQKYERGANRISFSRLVMLARALSVSAAWFFEDLEGGEAVDPVGARAATEFYSSQEGQAIAQAAPQLKPHMRRALADLARSMAKAA